jgi:hypothetical protein
MASKVEILVSKLQDGIPSINQVIDDFRWLKEFSEGLDEGEKISIPLYLGDDENFKKTLAKYAEVIEKLRSELKK